MEWAKNTMRQEIKQRTKSTKKCQKVEAKRRKKKEKDSTKKKKENVRVDS